MSSVASGVPFSSHLRLNLVDAAPFTLVANRRTPT